MILDKNWMYQDHLGINGAVGTRISANVIDHMYYRPRLERGFFWMVDVQEPLGSGGSATMKANLQTSDDEAFTSPVVVASMGPWLWSVWNTRAGARVGVTSGPAFLRMPDEIRRYTRVTFDIAVASLTQGTVTTGIVGIPTTAATYGDGPFWA